MEQTGPSVAAVILAAGASTRLGSPKQLIEKGGVPLVRNAAMVAGKAGASPVIVVIGANADKIAPALEGLDDVVVIRNPAWETGIASSLAAGLAGARGSDGALIMLSDQPMVDATCLGMLMSAFADGSRIVAAQYGQTIGVPVVIGREHFGALMKLEGDRGAAGWLKMAEGVTVIPMSAPSLDIDTPEDVARLRMMDSTTEVR